MTCLLYTSIVVTRIDVYKRQALDDVETEWMIAQEELEEMLQA